MAQEEKDTLSLFSFDDSFLIDPAAAVIRRTGLLRAKREALRAAERLAWLGRKLLFGVLAVSFLHIWEQISLIRPVTVDALPLPGWAYHISSGLLTLAIDAVAFYLVATRSVSAYAGNIQRNHVVWFYYVLTALLNGMFMLRYSPGMPPFITVDVVFWTQITTAALLAMLIPISIAAVEQAHHIADAARLVLIIETDTLAGQVLIDKRNAQRVQDEQTFQDELEREKRQYRQRQERETLQALLSGATPQDADKDTAQPLRLVYKAHNAPQSELSTARRSTYEAILQCLDTIPDLRTGRVAQRIGKTSRTVQFARDELEKMGIIRKDSDGGYQQLRELE